MTICHKKDDSISIVYCPHSAWLEQIFCDKDNFEISLINFFTKIKNDCFLSKYAIGGFVLSNHIKGSGQAVLFVFFYSFWKEVLNVSKLLLGFEAHNFGWQDMLVPSKCGDFQHFETIVSIPNNPSFSRTLLGGIWA